MYIFERWLYRSQLELSSVAHAMTGKLNRCSVEILNSYLFQSLSVEAECLIVQQTTDSSMNTHFIALVKE